MFIRLSCPPRWGSSPRPGFQLRVHTQPHALFLKLRPRTSLSLPAKDTFHQSSLTQKPSLSLNPVTSVPPPRHALASPKSVCRSGLVKEVSSEERVEARDGAGGQESAAQRQSLCEGRKGDGLAASLRGANEEAGKQGHQHALLSVRSRGPVFAGSKKSSRRLGWAWCCPLGPVARTKEGEPSLEEQAEAGGKLEVS